MKKATLTETKNNLSALIDLVRTGETILILDRGRPIARIESVIAGETASEGRLERLERQGLIRRATGPSPQRVLAKKPPAPRRGGSALDMMVAERRTGR
jgi:prevent-host-death family protein